MPNYLFQPLAREHKKLTFKTVNALANEFSTSPSATAIRLIECDHSPAIVVCHGPKGRKWFSRARSVPDKWFPQDALDADSFAFGVLFGNEPDDPIPRRIGADAWFDRRGADHYEVHEQTIRAGPDEVLT